MSWNQPEDSHQHRAGEKRASPFEDENPGRRIRSPNTSISTGYNGLLSPNPDVTFGRDNQSPMGDGDSQQSLMWSGHHGSVLSSNASSPFPSQWSNAPESTNGLQADMTMVSLSHLDDQPPQSPTFESSSSIWQSTEPARQLNDEPVFDWGTSVASEQSSPQGPEPNQGDFDKRSEDGSVIELVDEPKGDTCFGVLILAATSSGDVNALPAPVTIAPSGSVLQIRHKNTSKYLGLISDPAINALIRECQVDLFCHLHAEKAPVDKSKKIEKSLAKVQEHSVRIVIYGDRDQGESIRNALDDTELFLQTPTVAECSGEIEYYNPQYLLRPGQRMPQPDELVSALDDLTTEPAEQIDEVTQSKFQRIFDSASDWVDHVSIEPSPRLRTVLKSHQLTSLSFMIEKESGVLRSPKFPSIWKAQSSEGGRANRFRHAVTGTPQINPRPANGGILADDMGLGKTLSLLALLCSSIDAMERKDGSVNAREPRNTLVIAPKSTLFGWKRQIENHLEIGSLRYVLYHGSSRGRESRRLHDANLVLTTYETFRQDFASETSPLRQRWYRVVLDEAHRIRNRSSRIYQAVCSLNSIHRWCLTGTPIQNSLDDFGALLGFIGVPLMESKTRFDDAVRGVSNGDSKVDLEKLRSLVSATCLRRTKQRLSESCNIPQKVEKVEEVPFSPYEKDVYVFFEKRIADIVANRFDITQLDSFGADNNSMSKNILSLISLLRLICNHADKLLPEFALKAWRDRNMATVTWQAMRRNAEDLGLNDTLTIGQESTQTPHKQPRKQVTTLQNGEQGVGSGLLQELPASKQSSKILALLRNLQLEQSPQVTVVASRPEKSVVFSFFTKMLDSIEQTLRSRDYSFRRIDGKTSLEARMAALQDFNDDDSCTIMLASIGSAGEGVDFTAANHVHLIEPHWNPMAEAQAIDRVHRIGQSRVVTVIRYIMSDSIEKVSKSRRAIDSAASRQPPQAKGQLAFSRYGVCMLLYVQQVQKQKLELIDAMNTTEDCRQLDVERWQDLRKFLA